MVVTTGAIRHAKLQSERHRQQTNDQLYTSLLPYLSPNQQCRSTEGKNLNMMKAVNKTVFIWRVCVILLKLAVTNRCRAIYTYGICCAGYSSQGHHQSGTDAAAVCRS